MILVDTSAWVEFLRDTDSSVCRRVDMLLDQEMATCAVVRMEVLGGARDHRHLTQLRRLLARATDLAVTPAVYEDAATLYRACRRRGETVRRMLDCLIAATALSADVPVLHADVDFELLARHSDLRLA